jgi:hypothetical protein
MLDPWIIEEILKKEDEKRREADRQQPEMPVPRPRDTGPRPIVRPPSEEGERGVMIIDI